MSKKILSLLLIFLLNFNGMIIRTDTSSSSPVGDGSVGNSAVDNDGFTSTSDRLYYNYFTATGGDTSWGHVSYAYVASGSKVTTILFSNTGTVLDYMVHTSSSSTTDRWGNESSTNNYTLSNGVQYICGAVSNDSSWRIDTSTGGNTYYTDYTFTETPGNFTPADNVASSSETCSIIFNNISGDPS